MAHHPIDRFDTRASAAHFWTSSRNDAVGNQQDNHCVILAFAGNDDTHSAKIECRSVGKATCSIQKQVDWCRESTNEIQANRNRKGPYRPGGATEGPYQVGGSGGVSAPTCPVRPEPTYSDDARKAHIQGTVILDSAIQKDGTVDVNGVSRSLGYGLDDAAKDVLKKWKCNPGKLNGKDVAVQIQIVINFHLY
jgi:TonB family protein